MEGSHSINQVAVGTKGSKSRLSKSRMPLTPHMSKTSMGSKISETQVNARKNPLDALSRNSVRQQVLERRSGLQDVDEEYLARNIFSRPPKSRNASGLNNPYPGDATQVEPNRAQNANSQPQPVPVAGLPSQPQQVAGNGTYQQSENHSQQNYHTHGSHYQSPHQTQPIQSQNAINGMSVQQSVPQHHHQAQQQQPQMMQHQQPQMMQQYRPQVVQQQQPQMMQQQPQIMQQQQLAQQPGLPPVTQHQTRTPAGYAETPQQEPDMCTTCPNCQATIYLMRNAGQPVPTGLDSHAGDPNEDIRH